MCDLLNRELTATEKSVENSLKNFLGTEKWPDRAVIRRIAAAAPKDFLAAALSLLHSETNPRVRQQIYGHVMDCPEFLDELVRPDRLNRMQFFEICAWLKKIDDLFDIRLAQLAPRRREDANIVPPEALLRVMDVLDAISAGPRLVPVVSHLTHYPEDRVASKAAIFMTRRLWNENWLRSHLASDDSRLRASIVEGLWGVKSPAAIEQLRTCLGDENNRVVGNALWGLHLAGDPEVNKAVVGMLRDWRPAFRRTAAWLMGKIASLEFVEPLRAALGDENAIVRQSIKRALVAIQSAAKSKAEQQPAAPNPPPPAGQEVRPAMLS